MLDIRDTLACVELACLNPAETGEFRVFNQFTESFIVHQTGRTWWPTPTREGRRSSTSSPRVEKEEHYYRAAHTKLLDLGLLPHLLTEETLQSLLAMVERFKDRVDPKAFLPTVNWRHTDELPARPPARGTDPS